MSLMKENFLSGVLWAEEARERRAARSSRREVGLSGSATSLQQQERQRQCYHEAERKAWMLRAHREAVASSSAAAYSSAEMQAAAAQGGGWQRRHSPFRSF